MHFTQTIKLGLAVAGLCTLGAAAPSAEAQGIEYFTLSGVTFADGGTASGSFVFNPAFEIMYGGPATPVSSFNITTTSGVTDSFPGVHYGGGSPGSAYNLFTGYAGHDGSFVFNNLATTGGQLFLAPNYSSNNGTGTNVFPLIPGFNDPNLGASGSSENDGPTRQIVSGFLIESPNAVPEASTTVSLGLLLVLGAGGAVIAARKKKPAA